MLKRFMSSNIIGSIYDRSMSVVPWPKSSNRTCFFGLRSTYGGPGFFSRKLSREFKRTDVGVTYNRLRSAESALFFSVSWGDWMHRLCAMWDIKTVLRVDGFMVPTYYDNRTQNRFYQNRNLTKAHMAVNFRIQRDLLLADHVIYQSSFSKQMCDKYLYKRNSDYSIIYNGIDLNHFLPNKRENRRIRLLCAGSLRHEYMLGTILPVFNSLWKRYNLELYIVGTMDEICSQQLREFSNNNVEVSDRIIVVGSVDNDNMAYHLSNADILIHPRLGDWCPNVVIESLACGIPVVCGSWGGTSEIVGDGGIIVQTDPWGYGHDFVERLVLAVEEILASLDIYQVKARKQAVQFYDIRLVANKYKKAMGLELA